MDENRLFENGMHYSWRFYNLSNIGGYYPFFAH